MPIIGDDPVDLSGDHPKLDRKRTAEQWSETVRTATARNGLVIAVTGEWGSGKTSLLNMMHGMLESTGTTVVGFNPWMFSGTDQLVDFFFSEIAEQLEVRDTRSQSIAKALQKYGALFAPVKAIPVVGTTAGGLADAAKAAGSFMEERQRKDVRSKRAELSDELSGLPRPLVVVVDDIDRLTGREIRDMLRMVRLTGAFPNIIYLLSFDRRRVESALDEDGLPGRSYLEKIVQVVLDVPRVSAATLEAIYVEAVNEVLEAQADIRLTPDLFADVSAEIIVPMLRTVRDVRRLVAPLESTIRDLGDGVEAVDVLALEAVRVLLPDSFEILASSIEGLTAPSTNASMRDHLAAQAQRFVNSDSKHEHVLRAICQRIFPASLRHIGTNRVYSEEWAARWRRERRVASGSVLRYYLERVLPGELADARAAEALFAALGDEDVLTSLLDSLEPERAEAAITELEAYEADFSANDPAPAVTAILNQSTRLNRTSRGMLDYGSDIALTRVVYRLLRPCEQQDVLGAVERSIPRLTSLSAINRLLLTVGHTEGAGHELIAEQDDRRLTLDLVQKIRQASAEELSLEPDLVRLLSTGGAGQEWELPDGVKNDPRFATSLLQQAISKGYSQSLESRTLTIHHQVSDDLLIRFLGSSSALRQARDVAAETIDPELLAILDSHLEGLDTGR